MAAIAAAVVMTAAGAPGKADAATAPPSARPLSVQSGAATGWVSKIAGLHGPSTSGRGITYGGSTLVRWPDPVVIVLSRNRRSITHVTSSFEAPCQSGSGVGYILDAGGKLTVSRSGRFSGEQSFEGTVGDQPSRTTVTLDGRVTGKTMTGTAAYHAEILDATTGAVVDTCDQSARFRVAAARGRVFAGQTSQDGPVVLELTGSRRVVRHFHMSWEAGCQPDGFYQLGDTLTEFPIRRKAFGDTFTQRFSDDEGDRITFAYDISGRIRKARVSGTFTATRTIIDPTGVTISTCTSGPLRFVATSG